jgi:hypothetical protein
MEISPGDPIVVDVTGPNGAGDGLFNTVVAGGATITSVSVSCNPTSVQTGQT